ncbi:MAG: pilus assembly protein PilW [Paucimonas sp.]|nr:pilus assembly protein PilW [Paucimonas sp.]
MKTRAIPALRQPGLTLVEMLVCLALASALALAAIAALLSARAGFSAQDGSARVTENGLYALAAIERAIRQAGYENWGTQGAALVNDASWSPAIVGLDDARLQESRPALETPLRPGINGSDVLALRFFGSGAADGDGDGSMLNCAGAAVAEPSDGDLEAGRGWSIFHVARSSGGEPELRCKYLARSGKSWEGEALATGVESMQVLYGVDTDGDGLPDTYSRAGALPDPATQASGAGSAAGWKEVVTVRIALLVRSPDEGRELPGNRSFDFFGPQYSLAQASADAGVRFSESTQPAGQRKRLRRLFSLTIPLRQRAGKRSATAEAA